MNEIVNHGEPVHISMKESLDTPDKELALNMLEQLLDITYHGAELLVDRDKYGALVDINIRFDNVEDATHFKLTHLWKKETR